MKQLPVVRSDVGLLAASEQTNQVDTCPVRLFSPFKTLHIMWTIIIGYRCKIITNSLPIRRFAVLLEVVD